MAELPSNPDDESPLRAICQLVLAAHYDDARDRIWQMAGEAQFSGDNRTDLAQALEAAAKGLAKSDAAGARWLYERAIEVWYSWGAMATSGGDGASRAPHIRAAEARLAALFGASGKSGA